MKRFYTKFRVALVTFTLGFASVYFFDWFDNYCNEPRVDLPQVQSETPIIVFPREKKLIWGGGGSPCCDAENLSNKVKTQQEF
jgi:hypothetical protein